MKILIKWKKNILKNNHGKKTVSHEIRKMALVDVNKIPCLIITSLNLSMLVITNDISNNNNTCHIAR